MREILTITFIWKQSKRVRNDLKIYNAIGVSFHYPDFSVIFTI